MKIGGKTEILVRMMAGNNTLVKIK